MSDEHNFYDNEGMNAMSSSHNEEEDIHFEDFQEPEPTPPEHH